MKKMNKKGFTIVELVIVIAVIAILAAVMIPTFGGIIKKANDSAVKQEATSAYKEAYALAIADGEITDTDKKAENGVTETHTVGNFTFNFTGTLDNISGSGTSTSEKAAGYTFTIANGQLTVTAPAN